MIVHIWKNISCFESFLFFKINMPEHRAFPFSKLKNYTNVTNFVFGDNKSLLFTVLVILNIKLK